MSDLSRIQDLSREDKLELIALLEEKNRRELSGASLKAIYEALYGWQNDFIASTADHHESCLCAANQVGKTRVGTVIDSYHLLGEYPPDWPGHRFHIPPLVWGLGYSMEKTRDLLQTALFGPIIGGKFQGGFIPADRIVSKEAAGGTTNAMRTVRVKHVSGGISTLQLWSYSQGQHAMMGDVVDFFHIDEEPKDQDIRPQVLTRTINGDNGRGGRGIYTFTPENGRTELVVKFMDEPTKDQFFMQKGWSDAPHITKEKEERMLELYPTHQRNMRSKGTPMLGHGRIYDLSEDFLTCDDPGMPDHWYVIDGMDFGWDHPQAHIRLLEDRDNGCFYVTRSWKEREQSANEAWGATKLWSEGVPTAWPSDGLQGEKGRDDNKVLRDHYIDAGFTMLDEHATWPEGGVGVEAGLYEIADLARKGKFKICFSLRKVLDEILQYHRDSRGKIVKSMDDLLDAIRYAYMMRRFAIRCGDVGKKALKIKFKNFG